MIKVKIIEPLRIILPYLLPSARIFNCFAHNGFAFKKFRDHDSSSEYFNADGADGIV